MNDCCLAEFMEYRGQYRQDIYGAYDGCNCTNCKILRREKDPLKDRQAEEVVKNNWSYDRNK